MKDADWREIHKDARSRDSERIQVHDNEVDTLLVFAGLFSAILTAFIIDVYKDLKQDSGDIAANVLQTILALIEGGHLFDNTPDRADAALAKAHPSHTLTIVILLWFIGLLLSLAAALACIFMKQWLHAYNKWAEPSGFVDSLMLRGFYQLSLQKWRLYAIFTALGVLLQLALVFFVVGLVIYLWTFTFVISPVVTFLVIVVIGASCATLILPLLTEDCPYKFPSSHWVDRDLPTARRMYATHGLQSDRALRETALVIDVPPHVIDDALREATRLLHSERHRSGSINAPRSVSLDPLRETTGFPHSQGGISQSAIHTVQTRIRQLSPSSTELLIAVLTKADLCAAHKLGIEDQPWADHLSNAPRPTVAFPSERLLRLWKLVFCAMENPPTAIAGLLSHLAATLGLDTYSEVEHANLLADMLDHCGTLSKDGKLPPTELCSHALKVHDWFDEKARDAATPSGSVETAQLVSVRALYYATRHIPKSVVDETPDSGLSPVTPYLKLLKFLGEGITAQHIVAHAVAQTSWSNLIAESTTLLRTLMERHNSFLCSRARGYYPKTGVTAYPRCAIFSSDSNKLYVGSDEAEAWMLDQSKPEAFENLTPSSLPSGTAFYHAMFSRDGRWRVWGSRDGHVLVVDTISNQQRSLDDLIRGKRSRPMAISWDSKYAVFGSEDSWADVVDIESAEVIMSFEDHTQRLCLAAYAPSPYEFVATSSFDNTVKVWGIHDGVCVHTFDALAHSVNGVAWSPDGSFIAISSLKTILVYDWRKDEMVATFEGHEKLITGLSFSPNGKLVGSSSNDHTVRVWSVEKKSCVATLTGPEDDVNWVEFSPNGAYIAGAADNSVWVWDINPDCTHAAV